MPKVAYHVARPETCSSCVVFASPHSGRDYPQSFLRETELDEHSIRTSEDAFVDRLFDCAPSFGAPLLIAGAPRAFIDYNRASDELDPALIESVSHGARNSRVASGLGVVPRVVSNGRAIYRGKLPLSEAQGRLTNYWHPYHAQLQALLDEAHVRFGQSVLVDCHSMPHEAIDSGIRPIGRKPEIVLGDRFGSSASAQITDVVEAAFVSAGLVVARNAPFAGAYITQHYGRPSRGQHAVQIEIDRAIYMDERAIAPNDNFEAFRVLLRGVVAEIARWGEATEIPLAAE